MCAAHTNTDIDGGDRISSCTDMSKPCLTGVTQAECCGNCSGECTAWIYSPSARDCWLMRTAYGTHPAADRNCGGSLGPAPTPTGVSASVSSPATGAVLWSVDDLDSVGQNLVWPAPAAAAAYAIKDYPRFYVPPWGPTPAPPDVDPALANTSGYDFRNDQSGDTYVFLLGNTLDAWHAARKEFITLAGPTPLVPDFAFGTWFTWWHQYTEAEAKGEVLRWSTDKLPLDVWGLDMNWRNADNGHMPDYKPYMDHYYTYPNTDLFPDFLGNGTGWFDFLQQQGLRTYFNDHPFPANNGSALQTTPAEVAFRWAGLSMWMARGLTYWWFDANWEFSIPPPNSPYGGSGDGNPWQGMDNRVWGSHVYYTTVALYNTRNPGRNHTAPPQRPMTLTKYAADNMVPGLVQHQHPAHHRYPVWWTGDGVSLQASVESMVDSGLYDFKPYVHSDCGGDYRPKQAGDLVRWTEHCTFGTVFRYHGSQHQPWSYDTHTEDVIRTYLNTRYSFLPSLIAAAHVAALTAFPLVARGDIFWPEHAPQSADNHQYLFLNDTLVAPIWDSLLNVTSRTVWIPPGQWQDAWSGAVVAGPQTLTTAQPYERIPLWHRRGGLVVMAAPGLRVDQQDWSTLTLQAFPAPRTAAEVRRTVYPQNDATEAGRNTLVTMATDGDGTVAVTIEPDARAATRSWLLRVHLLAGETAQHVAVDGQAVEHQLIAPLSFDDLAFNPFGLRGSAPAPLAGPVLEVLVAAAPGPRRVTVHVGVAA